MASPGQMLLQGSQPALCTLSRGLLRLRGNQPLMTLEPGSPGARLPCSPDFCSTGVFGGRGRGGIPGTGRGQPEKKPGRQAGKQ